MNRSCHRSSVLSVMRMRRNSKKEGRMRKKKNITEDYVAMSEEKTRTRTPETR